MRIVSSVADTEFAVADRRTGENARSGLFSRGGFGFTNTPDPVDILSRLPIRGREVSVLAKRPKYSRWRRLPTAYWISEHKGPDPREEPQRITLYLPAKLLDMAEAQASKARVETLQAYCEELLARAILGEKNIADNH